MTSLPVKVASFRASPRLDTRRPGRYQSLEAHHASARRRQQLAADRAALAAEVTRQRCNARIPGNNRP